MVFTAIATVLVGSLGSFAVSFTAAALSFGAQYLLAAKQKKPTKQAFTAFQSETQYGTDIDMNLAFGTVLRKGHEIRYFHWGSGDKYNASVIVLSDFRCDGLEPYVFMNGEKYNLVSKSIIGNEHAHWGIEGFEDLTSVRFYDGRNNQSADQKLINDTANLGSTWKTTDAGKGICYVIFEREYSSAWDFDPDVSWVLRGLRCYDPRKDDTVSGGSGSHRIDNPDTWEFTKNPALQRYTYLYGLRSPITGRSLIGTDKSVSEIDINTHVTAANACDVQRSINGISVNTYECNIIVNSSDDFSEIIQTIDDSMAAYSSNRGGIAAVIVGAPQATTFDIEPQDIRVNEAINYRPKRNIDDLVNTLSGQYTNIEAQFSPASLETISVNADVAADNGIRQLQKDFLQITDPNIAQYVLQIQYRQNRKGKSIRLPITSKKYFGINAGDWGTYDGEVWMCTNKSGGSIQLTEVGNDIYQSSGIIAGPVPVAPVAPVNPDLISRLQGFAVSSGFVGSQNGSSRPVLSVQWTPPDDPSITGITINYRIQGSNERYSYFVTDAENGAATIDQNIVSGEIYVVSALIQTRPSRFTQSTIELSTATPTPSAAVVLDELQADTKEVLLNHSSQIEELRRSLLEVATATQNTQLNENTNRRANVQRIDRELVDENGAVAQAITAALVGFDTDLAEGLFDIKAVAAPSGVEVRIALLARASTDEGVTFEESGLFIDLIETSPDVFTSRIIALTDKFVITDGTDSDNPFTFIGGEMVFSGVIRSADNRFRIDGNAGQILISD